MNSMKLKSILVQATTIKLTKKDNYLYWAAAIKMAISGRRCGLYQWKEKAA